MNYYNDNDKFVAARLQHLIDSGQIPPGVVDDRSVVEVSKGDLHGFTQCHFFVGAGGWSRALELAGWPEDRPCWTGSCPCQPFRESYRTTGPSGFSDPRHLWPYWFPLIDQCRPPVIFGEQVTDAIRHGWLDLVFDNLEGIGYACGAAGLSAAGVGAPQRRERLYWMAQSSGAGLEGFAGTETDRRQSQWPDPQSNRPVAATGEAHFWSGGQIIQCSDGRRIIEPGTFPLAHGVPERVGKLKIWGNAIVPQVGAAFIRAQMDITV